MTTKKIYIHAKGSCWKRQLDANKIKNYLIKNNYTIVGKKKHADFIILVSCAFLNDRIEYSLERVKEFQKYKAELIVVGCLPAIEKDKLNEIFKGKTIKTTELEKIEEIFPPKNNIKMKDIEDSNIVLNKSKKQKENDSFKKGSGIKKIFKNIFDNYRKYDFSKRQYHIRIAWGCNWNCTYCTIKKTTGPFHSKPLDTCINEFKKGLKQGHKNIILDGTDVGAYGTDINSSFVELLDELTKITGDYKIMIREVHPVWINKYIDDLVNILKRNKIFIFDVAVQSANPHILKLMNRNHDVKLMKKNLEKLNNSSNETSMTGSFIIGFPSETWDEFMDTQNFIKDVGFNGGQIYLFSLREGTAAEDIEPKITEKEMVKRAEYSKRFLENAGFFVKYIKKERIIVFRDKI